MDSSDFSMTGASSAAIDIGGARTIRVDSDKTNDDMSFIDRSGMVANSPGNLSQIGASFVDVQNESTGSGDGATAIMHDQGYQFGMAPLEEESELGMADSDIKILPGESRIKINGKDEYPIEEGSIMVTNYRIVIIKACDNTKRFHVFPLTEIESMDLSNDNAINLSMKGGRWFQFHCQSNEDVALIHKLVIPGLQRLNRGIAAVYSTKPQEWASKDDPAPMTALNCFAWTFSEAVDKLESEGKLPPWLQKANYMTNEITHIDFHRLGMSEHFQISSVNEDFEVCPTYPEKVIVPKGITDDDIRKSAPYRSIGRFPAVIWRCQKTRAVLLRSSQPQVGILSWRNNTDEKIIEEVVRTSRIEGEEKKQFVIMDARGYASAFANRARSGGFENTEYYQQAKLEFLGLPNIHAIRASFTNIRTMLHAQVKENEQLLTNLQATGWLTSLSSLLAQAANCADHLTKGHSVLVHCSDGWDRTTQVTTLAKVMLDGHYRTIQGFEQLIRRDWIAFGHKLYDRQIGSYALWGEGGERSPIFLQFLEAVRHLQREQPTAFQFSHAYLIKLAKHAYSGLFGTFLFNSHKERRDATTKYNATLVEIWRFINELNEEFVNQSYDDTYIGRLKQVNVSVINLRVWHEVFADEGEKYTLFQLIYNSKEERPSSGCATPVISQSSSGLVKSKSSESINSLNVESSSHAMPNASSPSTDTANHPMTTSIYQQSMYQSTISGIDAMDFDGLTRFEDDEQATLRKKNKDRQEEIKLRDKQIEELKKRAELEKAVSPIKHHSFCESDSEPGRMERTFSDLSMVDPEKELPNFKPNTTWEAESPNCGLCQKEFIKLSVYQEDRQHHCRNCGRVVCEECSKRRYSTVEEGQSVTKRVCTVCYDSMCMAKQSSSPTPSSSSSSSKTVTNPEQSDNPVESDVVVKDEEEAVCPSKEAVGPSKEAKRPKTKTKNTLLVSVKKLFMIKSANTLERTHSSLNVSVIGPNVPNRRESL